jgi:hypothetical protein
LRESCGGVVFWERRSADPGAALAKKADGMLSHTESRASGDATPEVRRHRRGAWRGPVSLAAAVGVCAIFAALVLAGGALAESETPDQPTLGDRIEAVIRRDERLHYQVHMTMGRLLSLVPATRGKAAEQFRKASYHTPEDMRLRQTLLSKFPDAALQVDALAACHGVVREQLRQSDVTPVFPDPGRMTEEELEQAVFASPNGLLNVVQEFGVRPKDAAATDAPWEALFTCDVRKTALGRWQQVALRVAY